MSLRKQTASRIPSDGNAKDENCEDEFSSSLLTTASTRDKHKRERKNRSKSAEMTEEEMMDLALRLSEQEANVTASRLQQEEEAVLKAIRESMVGQAPSSHIHSLLTEAEASPRETRRKLIYSKGKKTSTIDQGALADECPAETGVNHETGNKNNNQKRKRKRKAESPPEMPDSQASPGTSESLSVSVGSPQSSDSTQVDDCHLRKSPVFPSSDCKATVCVSRLSQDLLETCKTSGFVLCSQDSWMSTFPTGSGNVAACPKSPVFSDTDQGNDVEMEPTTDCQKSPVFGNRTPEERSPRACRPPVCENSGFIFSSQESLTSTVRSTSCPPKSPVFPSSRRLPKNIPLSEKNESCTSPVSPETKRGRKDEGFDPNTKNPSAAELGGLHSELDSPSSWDQSRRQDDEPDHTQDGGFNKATASSQSDAAKGLNDKSKDCISTETDLTSDMTLIWSDEDDNNITFSADSQPVGSPSPVFPEERSIHHGTAAPPETADCRQPLCTTEQTLQQAHSLATACGSSTPCGGSAGGPTVHYYWGVPFCPQGLDPDSYTQVILTKLDVYEKSLKEAQRSLLTKATWGEPILPQPEKSPSSESQAESPERHIPQRLGLRLRGKNRREAGDNSAAEAEEEEEEEDKEAEEGEAEKETENKEEEKNEGQNEEDADDCEVCPETQLSDDGTKDLTTSADAGAQLQPQSQELPEVEMVLQDRPPAGDRCEEEEEEMDVDVPGDRKTEDSRIVGGLDARKGSGEADVEEVKDPKPQRSASPELEPAAIPQNHPNVDCPICQGSFPATEIEIHAAYCDGDVSVVDERRPEANSFQTSLKQRRKRPRRTDVTEEDANERPHTSMNQEKCYVCHKAVSLRHYSHHTELCIQRRASKTDTQKGDLLSALEQTEALDSEAGPSTVQPGEVIDLRDEDEEDDGVSAFRISNSPIRSFTPISEATDCLIDFRKQQRSKKPSRRRR